MARAQQYWAREVLLDHTGPEGDRGQVCHGTGEIRVDWMRLRCVIFPGELERAAMYMGGCGSAVCEELVNEFEILVVVIQGIKVYSGHVHHDRAKRLAPVPESQADVQVALSHHHQKFREPHTTTLPRKTNMYVSYASAIAAFS